MKTIDGSRTQTVVSITTGDFTKAASLSKTGRSLSDIMAYENPDVVARLSREEELTSEEAYSVFKDVLLFLWLGQRARTSIAPTKRIDLGWHAFLLFTLDYREFCQKFFGGFIDHHPRRLGDQPDSGKMATKSRDLAETVLVHELDLSLSRNWLYERLESQPAGAPEAAKCCGNCGSDCCKR